MENDAEHTDFLTSKLLEKLLDDRRANGDCKGGGDTCLLQKINGNEIEEGVGDGDNSAGEFATAILALGIFGLD